MNTLKMLGILVVGAALTAACDSPEKSQNTADKARQEADDLIRKAQTEADQTKLKSEAEAKQKQDQANAALASAKTDYVAKLNTLVTDMDKKAADLSAANLTASIRNKNTNEDAIKLLIAKKEAIKADLKSLETTNAAGWDAFKTQVDRDMSDSRFLLAPTVGHK